LGTFAWAIAATGLWLEARADGRGETEDYWGQAEGAPSAPRFELWAGAQAFKHAWSLYTGASVAPFAGIQQDGVRLRVVGGFGGYSYSGPRALGVGSHVVKFTGAAAFTDVLVGYHKQLGPLTVKVFAGLAAADHEIRPDDPETAIRGPGLGGKVAFEGWWSISDRAWTSVDVSWGSLYHSYAARGRLGWRFLPALSAGLETGAAGNQECDIIRAGGFLRYEWASGEVSVSGGLSNDRLLEGIDGPGVARSSVPFATLSWLTRF
jgi:hypothetical protein